MQYVNRMKDALASLNATADQIYRKIDYNNANFLPDVAAEANARLQAEMNAAAEKIRDKIDAIRRDAQAAVRKWAEPTGSEIDREDLALLNGSFQLSSKDLHNLLVKHQKNGTMVNAIAKYSKEKKVPVNYIPNVEDKLHYYDLFAKSAHGEVSAIVGSGPRNISSWGARSGLSPRAELVLYGIEEIPEPAEPPKAKFEFTFSRLPGR